MVVTDGEASDAQLMERVIPQVLARGITLDAIGLDMVGDHSLATKVHNYRRADDQDSLTQAIAASFAEVGSDEQGNLDQWFAELAGLDVAVADAVIAAYARSGNQPIDPNARPEAIFQPRPDAAPQGPDHHTSSSSADEGISWSTIFIIIVAVFVISGLRSKSKGQGRRS